MTAGVVSEPNPHLLAIRDAWRDFVGYVAAETIDLAEDLDGNLLMPKPMAFLYAVWKGLAYRFRRHNLEKLFRPLKAERREWLSAKSEYVFICGPEGLTDEWWAEADALVAEFGGPFPPRDWEPYSAAETVGAIMGMSREEVAAIGTSGEQESPGVQLSGRTA